MVEEESEMDDDGDDCISKEHKDVCESKCGVVSLLLVGLGVGSWNRVRGRRYPSGGR